MTDAEIVALAIRKVCESPQTGTLGRRVLEDIADQITHIVKEQSCSPNAPQPPLGASQSTSQS